LPPGGKPVELGTKMDSLPLVRASGDGGNFPHWANGGATLHWTLGATAYSAGVDELFAFEAGDDSKPESAYAPPAAGASLTLRLAADVPDGAVATGAKIVTWPVGWRHRWQSH
jgi:hypothetical protein